MAVNGISAGQISSMLEQIRAMSAEARPSQAAEGVTPTGAAGALAGNAPTASNSFASVLSQSLSQVSQMQQTAESLGNRFAAGDNSVSLSQAMIAMQKGNIAFQEAVQVRDRVVSAYTTIMNMQV